MMKNIRFGWSAFIIAATFVLVTACASTGARQDAASGGKEAASKVLYGPNDARMEGQLLIFDKDPSFKIPIPADLQKKPRGQWLPYHIMNVGKDNPPFAMEVGILAITEPALAADAKAKVKDIAGVLEGIGGTSVKVLRIAKINTYGHYEAWEGEVAWEYGTATFKTMCHYIYKNGKVISLTGTTTEDPKYLTGLFEAIKLD